MYFGRREKIQETSLQDWEASLKTWSSTFLVYNLRFSFESILANVDYFWSREIFEYKNLIGAVLKVESTYTKIP